MKNNLENQDIKTDKPVPMSYEALKADRDAQQKRADALAVESAALKDAIPRLKDVDYSNDSMDYVSLAEDIGFNEAITLMNRRMNESPATDAALAAIEARVWAEAKDLAKSMLATDSADHIDFLFDGKIQQLREAK
ncbi:hypothetical protein SFB10_3587 [Serratia liquefaciens]|uniref:hypothetical protein n=1 Tax=Serratia liquefaciens TaxID=614 RepID=UPI00141D5B21|nr:hypothetical protein [Serratia liquefaciens]CAB1223551.1 hypothetical protein SFB10_3587 [Serratia liquefaciens]